MAVAVSNHNRDWWGSTQNLLDMILKNGKMKTNPRNFFLKKLKTHCKSKKLFMELLNKKFCFSRLIIQAIAVFLLLSKMHMKIHV